MSERAALRRWIEDLGAGRLSRREFVSRAMALGLGLGPLGVLLSACQRAEQQRGSDVSAAAETPPADLGPLEKKLAIYNWSDYIAEDTVANFEKEFGVQVTYDTFESNEEMVAKLQAGASGYDIVVPSSYVIPVLAATKLLAPLQKSYLTRWGNLSPILQNLPSDPNNVYSVPWQWGTSGFAYRTDKITTPLDSWGVFFESRYGGRMTMMDDVREVIGAMLRYRGHSLNSLDLTELGQARTDAIAAKKNLKAYLSAPVKAQLISGDVWLAQLWNGDTTQAKKEQPNLTYVVPKEGCTIWCDALVVPASAPHKRAAHEFMNYILRPEVAAGISNTTGYGTPNQAAAARVADPVPYPSADELRRLEYPVDLGADSQLWDQIWTEIKSA